jgi:hypothetical protein
VGRGKASVVRDPTFGPMPAWCNSLRFRALLLVIYCGMGLGLGVLWPSLAPWPFDHLAGRLSKSAQAVAILALVFGSLFGTLYFGALALWQSRLRRSEEPAADA